MNKDQKQIEKCFAKILQILKVTNVEILENTPRRASKALLEMTSGDEALKNIEWKTFEIGDSENTHSTVLIKNIEFVSLCEHHLLPFRGTASVAYIPKNKVVGLSKIPRVVKAVAQNLQLQERLTKEIALEIDKNLETNGVAVYLKATHSCMSLRGVKSDAQTVTKYFSKSFSSNEKLQQDFLSEVRL